VGIMFLSVSFVLATLAAHFREGLITRKFYFLSGFWLGLFLNLLLAVICGRLIAVALGWAGYAADPILFGGPLFALALAYSLYGAWNAFNPRITDIQITIKNLPERWKGKNIVQLSDIHLGHVYREGFLEKVVQLVNGLSPEMVVITGDLFDGMDGNLDGLVGPLNGLRVPDGIYFITGNHETYLGVDKAFSILKKTQVSILDDEVKDVYGLQLVGISYPERGEAKDIVKSMEALPGFEKDKPTILLYHSPVQIETVKNSGVGLQLSGHTHAGQIFPLGLVTRLIYKGYDYGLHTSDGYSIYTTNGVGTWGPPMRTGNTPEIVNITLN